MRDSVLAKAASKLIAVPFLALTGGILWAVETAQDLGLVRKEFRVGDRKVRRPEAFDAGDRAIVFAIVGGQLEQLAADGAVLESFTDRNIGRITRYARYSLEAWHDVLDFFVTEGIIVRSWRLVLPKEPHGVRVPTWDANGHPLPDPARIWPHDARTDAPSFFWPDRLDDATRARLLGTRYACEPSDGPGDVPLLFARLEEQHFETIHAIPKGSQEWPHVRRGGPVF